MNNVAKISCTLLMTALATATSVSAAGIHSNPDTTEETIQVFEPDNTLVGSLQISDNDDEFYSKMSGTIPLDDTEEEIKIEEPKTVELGENPNSKWDIGEAVPLPDLPTFVMFGTDYHRYDLWYTPHYRMRLLAETDEHGARKYRDCFMVGLGSYYTEDIGDVFEITLDNGYSFRIILGDGKADGDTDDRNMYTPVPDWFGEECANVLEFIIDAENMPNDAYESGGMHYFEEFQGNIESMVYLGRDTSNDWTTYYTVNDLIDGVPAYVVYGAFEEDGGDEM